MLFAPTLIESPHIDDDNTASTQAIHPDLGTIQVEMRHVDYYVDSGGIYSGLKMEELGPVHERSKKAGVHAISSAFLTT